MSLASGLRGDGGNGMDGEMEDGGWRRGGHDLLRWAGAGG